MVKLKNEVKITDFEAKETKGGSRHTIWNYKQVQQKTEWAPLGTKLLAQEESLRPHND